MREVVVTLKFTSPCLGNDRREDCDLMLRSSENKVKFFSTWWQNGLRFGAQALNKYQRLVRDVKVDIEIDGTTKIFKRYYGADVYKCHEAFLDGAIIGVTFMLPNGLPIGDFETILTYVGKYIGISPYRGGKKNGDCDFGRFVIVEIRERGRCGKNNEGTNRACGKPD